MLLVLLLILLPLPLWRGEMDARHAALHVCRFLLLLVPLWCSVRVLRVRIGVRRRRGHRRLLHRLLVARRSRTRAFGWHGLVRSRLLQPAAVRVGLGHRRGCGCGCTVRVGRGAVRVGAVPAGRRRLHKLLRGLLLLLPVLLLRRRPLPVLRLVSRWCGHRLARAVP